MNYEENAIKKVATYFDYLKKKKMHMNERLLLAFNLALFDNDNGEKVLNYPNVFFDLMSSILCGFIKKNSKIIYYKTPKNNANKNLNFLVFAYLITLEFLETFEFTKAIENTIRNSEYILKEIDLIISNDLYDEDLIQIDKKYYRFLLKEIPLFIAIIGNSGQLLPK